ncbi:hypothetical protein GCM10020256_32220 [Streptomyces thermocoprophilus]
MLLLLVSPLLPAGGSGSRDCNRGDVLVYGVEDRRHLLADIAELHGQLLAQGAPGLAVGAGEGRQGLDGAQGVGVAVVGRAQQTVALGGVVGHPGQGAADLAEGLVVELAAASALHEAAGLAQAGGGLVEVGATAFVVVVGQVVELEVLDAALEAVERVAGQGVGTGRGDSAEGAGGDSDTEAARGEALREPRTRAELAERGRPVRPAGPGGPLLGYRRVCLAVRAFPQHGLERGHELGPLDDLDLGVELRLGQRTETGGEGDKASLLGLVVGGWGRCRSFGLLGRRAPIGLLLQGLGEGVRPPVRRYVRDHWRHLLSS